MSAILCSGTSFLICCVLLVSLCLHNVRGTTTLRVEENKETGFVIGRAHDSNSGSSCTMYSFSDQNDCGIYFTINSTTSVITVKNQSLLDREAMPLTSDNILVCTILCGTNPEGINIEILDINEAPKFHGISQPFIIYLPEAISGYLAGTLRPVDDDNGRNGTISFNITSGNEGGYFQLRVPEGKTESSTDDRDLFVVRELDYDQVQEFQLEVTIRDEAIIPLQFMQLIRIFVNDTQDEPPTFSTSAYTFEVPEDHPAGINNPFANVTASTGRGEQNIVYEIGNSNGEVRVGVNPQTGGLYLMRRVDYENLSPNNEFTFTVTASNSAGINEANIRVIVTDVANEPLYFMCEARMDGFPCPMEVNGSEFSIEENRNKTSILLKLSGSDNTYSFTLNSSIIPEDIPLTAGKVGNNEILITENVGLLDRERVSNITVTLITTINEAPYLQSITTFYIRVLDRNDNKPVFSSTEYDAVLFEGSPVGRKILQVEATDADIGENGTVLYSITSINKEEALSWFKIDTDSGVISVSSSDINYPTLDGSITLNVIAIDNGTNAVPTSVAVNIKTVLSTFFSLNSYQQYTSENINLLSNMSQNIYLEFLPMHNGILLFQQDQSGDTFSISYQDDVVTASFGGNSKNRTFGRTSENGWTSVFVQKVQQQITSLEVGPTIQSNQLLQNLTVLSCSNSNAISDDPVLGRPTPLYIGGVNVFELSGNVSITTGFTGGIRNVIVGDTQLDMSCPTEQVNTRQGVASTSKCSEISCTSSHSIGCVDLNSQPFCQCLGGFSAQTCKINNDKDAETSYSPIRFMGKSGARLSLGYTFFVDLVASQPRDTEDARSVANNEERRQRRNTGADSRDTQQVIELSFRPVNLMDSVLLSSQTDSSTHTIEILKSTNGIDSYLTYSILPLNHENASLFDLTLRTPLRNNTLYHLRVILTKREITMEVLEGIGSTTGQWESNEISEVPVFAQQPTTSIAIGSSLQSEDLSFFTGCITHFAIDNIEVPLSGLLAAGAVHGGFEVNNLDGVVQFCDLCDSSVCHDNRRQCISGMLGEVSCQCKDAYLESNSSCVPSSDLEPKQDNNTYYIIAGGAAGGILIFGICIISIIVLCRRSQERKKAGRYSVNNTNLSRNLSRSRRDNDYNDHSPSIVKKNSSFTSSMNGNCTTETHELRSSISTFQEHAEDADPESNSPLHQNVRGRRKSCTSVESGIKLDEREMSGISARGIPTMEDSGHEVNSTDSNRTSESYEIASSCYNDQPQSRPSVTLGRGSSPDHRIPRTPLTPQEKKVMIPLRPPSTNLSQSEFDEEEAIETGSFHTRVSSSSGMGNSMQNQGRGSDTDSSKTSDSSRWYLPTSGLDKEKIHLQTLQPYYQQRLGEPIQSGRAYPPEIPPYHSPPTFTEHTNRNFRARSKSLHSGKSPASPHQSSMENPHMPSTPSRSYENYPRKFNIGEMRGNGVMYKQNNKLPYNSHHFSERDLDTSRVANDHDYTPSSVFSRQYSDPKIPRNGNYCIPRKHDEPWPVHNRQISDPHQSSQQIQDSTLLARGTHAPRHMDLYPSNGTSTSTSTAASSIRHPPVGGRQFYTLGHGIPKHVKFAPTADQQAHSFSNGEMAASSTHEPYQTLNSLSKIDPISNWDAQDRMKIAVDHMDPCHLLSGPCIPFEYVSTDPSVVESQTTVDESIMGGPNHQMFESQGGGEGMPHLLNHLDMNMNVDHLREDEIDSMLTDSEVGQHQVMNHFPSADCSSQYTTTIVAGSTSTSGESTPKLQNVFVMPSSQQSFDV